MHFTGNRFLFEATEAWSWNCLKHTEPTLTSKINYKNPPHSLFPLKRVVARRGTTVFFKNLPHIIFPQTISIYNRKNIHSTSHSLAEAKKGDAGKQENFRLLRFLRGTAGIWCRERQGRGSIGAGIVDDFPGVTGIALSFGKKVWTWGTENGISANPSREVLRFSFFTQKFIFVVVFSLFKSWVL